MYKITKSETKKIGTIKLPKGVCLHLINSQNIGITINPDVAPYIDKAHVIHNIRHIVLNNYANSYNMSEMLITLSKPSPIEINCTKSDCTNEWTFYEKVEDTVKVNPNTPEETWAEAAYTFTKGKSYNPYK